MEDEKKSSQNDNENSSAIMKKFEEMVVSEEMTQSALEEPNTSFTREMDNFYCDFSITKQGLLRIILNSILDATVSALELTPQQKKSQEQLNFFQSIQEIYQYLQDNTSDEEQKNNEERLVRIDEAGKVLMTVVSTIGKKERKKDITLTTSKIQQNRELYLQKLVKRISKNMLDLRSQVRQLQAKQQDFDNKNIELIQKLKAQGDKLTFTLSKSDPHLQKFKIAEKRVTKVLDDTSYFSLISQKSFNKTGVSYFRIRVVHSSQKNIIVGVGSKFIRGVSNAYTHPDFIGFYPYGQGYVWQKTNQRQLHLKGIPIQNGVVITTIVDMDLGYVGWEICRVRVAYALIPLELKAKMLLPTVMMVNVNDCLEIL